MIDVKTMTFADIGEAFTKIDADRSLVLHQFLSKIGDEPTFESWESARIEWGTGYKRVKTAATEDAVNTAWSRFVTGLRAYAAENGYTCTVPEKPKSTNPEAQKKAEQRKNPFDGLSLDDARAKQKEITGKVAESQKAGQIPDAQTLTDMAKITETVVKLEREAGKLRVKAAQEKLAPRIDKIRKYLKGADERMVALIETLIDANDMRNPESVRGAAWDVIRKAMPDTKPAKGSERKAA